MASSTRASISAFPRGHSFEPASFALSREQVRAYVDATGDTNDYGDGVPPLAAVALGLASLQQQVSLPEGSLHTGQETEHEGTLRAGEALRLRTRIAQRSERQGFVISVIEFEIGGASGGLIHARTTIMAPASTGAA